MLLASETQEDELFEETKDEMSCAFMLPLFSMDDLFLNREKSPNILFENLEPGDEVSPDTGEVPAAPSFSSPLAEDESA